MNDIHVYTIPLFGQTEAKLVLPRPLTVENYEILMSWLGMSKEALLTVADEPRPDTEGR